MPHDPSSIPAPKDPNSGVIQLNEPLYCPYVEEGGA